MGGPGWHCMLNNLIRNILPLTHSNVIIMVLCLSVHCAFFLSLRIGIKSQFEFVKSPGQSYHADVDQYM